jgi:predicted metal-dependent phosphoesterase TrpH
MKNRWIDFHTHTTYSDGMTDPESWFRQAFVEGLKFG